jgi:Zn finger protein HypA/HybF involved in hydrogenase expression
VHELSVAQRIVESTRVSLVERGGDPARARAIHIRVGELSGVDATALEECLRVVLPLGPLSAARAVVVREPALLDCPSCGEVECSGPFRLVCPRCGRLVERVRGGNDVVVESVEVGDDE